MKGQLQPDGIDGAVVRYIESVRLERKLFGIDEVSFWTVIGKVQQYYERKDRERQAALAAELRLLRAACGGEETAHE